LDYHGGRSKRLLFPRVAEGKEGKGDGMGEVEKGRGSLKKRSKP